MKIIWRQMSRRGFSFSWLRPYFWKVCPKMSKKSIFEKNYLKCILLHSVRLRFKSYCISYFSKFLGWQRPTHILFSYWLFGTDDAPFYLNINTTWVSIYCFVDELNTLTELSSHTSNLLLSGVIAMPPMGYTGGIGIGPRYLPDSLKHKILRVVLLVTKMMSSWQ